jgi:uncharacterized membrane protein YfcA
MALYNLYRLVRPGGAAPDTNRLGWLAAVALPIGAEVGFSSAGAGDYNSTLLGGLALGGLGGVLLGAWLSSVLPARPLRAALSVALFPLGIELCWKAWS